MNAHPDSSPPVPLGGHAAKQCAALLIASLCGWLRY
jgi:hypothetical protein